MSTENDNTVPYRWSLPLTIDGKILNAAYEVLTEKGITGATISEIAQRAGVSRPTLYRRFKDMDDVISSLVTSLIVDMMNQRYQLVDDVDELIDLIINFVVELRAQPLIQILDDKDGGTYLSQYFVNRLGTSQRELLAVLTAMLHHCRAVNPDQLRDEDDMELASIVLLILQNTSVSAQILSGIITATQWQHLIRYAIEGLLKKS
ncbi:MAG: TetR/AcrR family transcriptional regulator [Lawsonella sp.]